MAPTWMYRVAIAAGNRFVLEPGPLDPTPSIMMARLPAAAGPPDGVCKVVQGDKDAVDALPEHPDVKAVSFVGSTAVAQKIRETGARHGKRVQALGGAENHMVGMPDTDLDQAVDALIGSAGERCMAISPAVLVGGAADRIMPLLAGRTRQLKVKNGTGADAETGPIVSGAAQQRIAGHIGVGEKDGAKLVVDGRSFQGARAGSGCDDGFWIGGTLFDHVTPEMKIYREEIFGPVLGCVCVSGLAAAAGPVNSHECGNGVSCFTGDGPMARGLSRRVRALESRLRVRLFELRNGDFVATPDAQQLLEVAARMDEAARSLRHAAIDEERELRGEIRVSTMEGFAVEYLAERLARFAAAYPRLRIELVTAARPLSLTDHEADVSLNMVRPRDGPLRVRQVGEFDVGLYASTAYLKARGEPRSLGELETHAFVGYVHDLQTVQETRWLQHWIAPAQYAFANSSLPAQARAVAAGAGIAALPAFIAGANPALRRVLPDDPGVRSQWWRVTRARDKPVQRVQALGDFIAQAMRADERLLRFQADSARIAAGERGVESTLRRNTSGRA